MIDFRKVGRKISSYRKRKNLSQDELAERMYVSRQLVSKWENGTGIPKIDYIIDLCEILDVNFEELLCLNDEKEGSRK
ncbi:MAG: helix-turn-helix transcriptional regulator [Candidatus Enterosoma sp.]|nr:helix-turn-helix transcriptional regulator [bacterium]MDY5866129.1 helix-turn-helix transcriptional regulator [Candidatus Enterosoma sp.]